MKILITIITVVAFSVQAADKPNIVFILADDMGYGDLGCYGHPRAKTPVIDKLAKQGVRFTQHYSNGTECSPTRTAFLTGRYPQRAGGLECAIGTGNVGRYDEAIRLASQRQLGLPANQVVIPSALKLAGYVSGVFGKWHLGYEPQFNPMEHGWDDFFGYMGGNVHYFNHRETSELHVLYRGRLPVHAEGYMTHLITDSSISFIERNKDKPFFLFVSHECPHFPFQGPNDAKKEINKTNWMKPDADTYVAMLEDLDSEVGRLLTVLDKHELTDNTLVIFVSDNGGFSGAANMGSFSGAKSTTMEGGIRVPLIMRWPGKIRPGYVSDQVCMTFDLTRSLINLTQAKVPAMQLDGFDLVSHISKRKPNFPRTLFWRGKRGERTWTAVRDGDMKFVRKTESQTQEWLFDLSKDLGEKNDLSSVRPGQVARLKKLLLNWEKEVKPVR